VQVEPIKPTLKAPNTKRLKRNFQQVLSKFAFRFNLRRDTEGEERGTELVRAARQRWAGAYTRPLLSST